jgi:hypothetical protein
MRASFPSIDGRIEGMGGGRRRRRRRRGRMRRIKGSKMEEEVFDGLGRCRVWESWKPVLVRKRMAAGGESNMLAVLSGCWPGCVLRGSLVSWPLGGASGVLAFSLAGIVPWGV